MFRLELGQVVHVLVDDDPEVILGLVRCDIVFGEALGHGGCARCPMRG